MSESKVNYPQSSYNFLLEAEIMARFDDAWIAVAQPREGERVSPELQPLVRRVYSDAIASRTDLSALKYGLTSLLEYLSEEGRTNANCWAVDTFFCLSERWERDYAAQNLPDDFHDLLAMMGEALHDTVKAPEIAENLDCLPEQLLERVRRLHIPGQ